MWSMRNAAYCRDVAGSMMAQPYRQHWYNIQVERSLGPGIAALFPELTVVHTGDVTELRGAFRDQAALHGVLARIRDLGLTLVSVARIDSPEEYI